MLKRSWVMGSALVGALILSVAPADSPPARSPLPYVLKLADCRLPAPAGLPAVEARCGVLEVSENPSMPEGGRVGLRVAVVPALNREGPKDPLFVLSGGPGQAASEFYPAAAGAFARVQRDRDIVLVDQRGTGGSNSLQCAYPDDDELVELSSEQVQTLTRECLSGLKGDPRYYTTSVAVQDLERVRTALGYERINLYGISYGTRVAQHYLRRYPAQVRTIVLDGIIPAQQAVGATTALDAQRALDQIFQRCRDNKDCHKAFPDPAGDFARLSGELSRTPAEVTMPDPVTAAVSTVKVRPIDLQMAVRLLSYNSEQAALLPLLLHEGAVRKNLAPIAGQSQMITEMLTESLSIGMHNAVVCTEDVPFYKPTEKERLALKESYLGTLQLDQLVDSCAIWPRGALDKDFHEPLKSDVPALLLSGSADPVTPAEYGKLALAGYRNGIHLILEGQGHGQLGTGCMPRLMAEFLSRGSAKDLDTACVKAVKPAPFFLSFSGPAP